MPIHGIGANAAKAALNHRPAPAAGSDLGCILASTMRRSSSTPFDMLVSDGEDIRKLPLSMRKTNLSRLLAAVSTASA